MHVEPAPSFSALLERLGRESFQRALEAPTDPRSTAEYLHWDKLRHLAPPAGLTSDEWWFKLKLERSGTFRRLPLIATDGEPCTYSAPDEVLRRLHRIDQRCSGTIVMDEVVTGEGQAKRQYLVNSLMEEAIRSSQLEGAATSRQVAKELLRTGRAPRDRSERMILNNYRGMMFMRDDLGDQLTPDAVLTLHRILTEDTLDNPDAAGRLQRPDEERIAVVDRQDGSVLHRPPPAEELPARLQAFCDFANDVAIDGPFVHPVVRAIILHFWLAYDHPFEDGNGRTTRAIFYWSMRRSGYWLTDYLSISRILRDAPGQYVRAFLQTETDGGDITYFLVHQLRVIERAIDELHVYLRRKADEVRAAEEAMRDVDGLNHRQLALLSEALRDNDRTYTLIGHANTHGVTHETARSDLADLERRGLLVRTRRKRPFVYAPPTDLAARVGGSD